MTQVEKIASKSFFVLNEGKQNIQKTALLSFPSNSIIVEDENEDDDDPLLKDDDAECPF